MSDAYDIMLGFLKSANLLKKGSIINVYSVKLSIIISMKLTCYILTYRKLIVTN